MKIDGGLHMSVSGEGHFKWLDTKYKTLFVYKYTFIYKVLYKKQTTIQISEVDSAITTLGKDQKSSTV